MRKNLNHPMEPRACTSGVGIDLDKPNRKSYLLPLMTPSVAADDDYDDDALQQQTQRSNSKPARRNSVTKTTLPKAKMPKSMSMLEMNDIQDMRLFGEEMDALSAEPSVAAVAADESHALKNVTAAHDDDDEDGFFIGESSDRSDDSADQAATIPATSTTNFLNNVMSLDSPDRSFHIPSSGGGMRRVMSMASLPSKKFGGNLQVIAPLIHTISEHANEEDDIVQETMRSRTSEVGLDESLNLRKPLSRQNSSSSMASGGMPIRSSMKGSRNNLRLATMESDASQAQSSQAFGLDGSINGRRSSGLPRNLSRSSLRGSGNSSVSIGEDASQVQASLDGSVNGRRPSRSSRLTRRLSRSNLRGSGNNFFRSNSNSSNNNVNSSFNSTTSVPSMDNSNHSLNSNKDGDANIDDSIRSAPIRSAQRDSNMKRNVSFASLEIRTYNVTLGDAPTSNGPPVSLSWDYDPAATVEHAIDHYEKYRTKEPRRNKHEMHMPAMHRQYLLMREAGISKGEIKIAMSEAQRCAKQRVKTVKGVRLGLQPVEEVLERTKQMLSFRKKR